MNQKRSGGVNGFTLLAFVIFLFTSLWLTNQFDERENQLTWAEFEKVIVIFLYLIFKSTSKKIIKLKMNPIRQIILQDFSGKKEISSNETIEPVS